MPASKAEIADRASTQFAALRALCYPESPAVPSHRSVVTFSQQTTTHAKTDGRYLTKINTGFFQNADVETQFITLLHEVTHANDGSSYGRGDSAHSPTFWEEYQRNFTTITESTRARRVVESLFAPHGRGSFDWHRAKYRAIQHVTQVDNRSETQDERRRKLADAIGYDGYDDFENSDWGLSNLVWNPRLDNTVQALQANLFGPTQRYAADYTDEELLAFIDEQGGHGPLPLVVLDVDDWRNDGPQLIREPSHWRVFGTGAAELASRKALAVQERCGHGYYGLCAELLVMVDEVPDYVADACPIDPDDLRPSQIDICKRSVFD